MARRSEQNLSAARLRELLSYDRETGAFVWRIRRGSVRAGAVAGTPDAKGYLQIQVDGVNRHAHQLAWLYETGALPATCIDHRDGDPRNNRLENLREIPHQHNIQNRRRPPKNNRSGFLGVCASGTRYRAYIVVDKKQKHLGCFATDEEAYAAALAARRSMYPGFTL